MKDEWWLNGPIEMPLQDEEQDDGEDAYYTAIEKEEIRFYDYITKI